MTKRQSLMIAAALLLFPTILFGQSTDDQTPSPYTKHELHIQCQKDEIKNPSTICDSQLKTFLPTIQGRIGRGFQYQYQIAEQFRSVIVGSGNSAQILQNPEHYLNQHSLKFQFSELFISASDLDSAVKQIVDQSPSYAKQFQLETCGAALVTCLATGSSLWKRTLSGLTVTGSLSERQAVLLSSGFAPEGSFSDHYGVTGEIDFDPTLMFVGSTNWKSATDALQKITFKPSDAPCLKNPTTLDLCAQRLDKATLKGSNERSGLDAFLEVAIPTFKFQRMSQFDFVKNGALLIPAPFPESALNTYSFTWDLKKLIAPTASRITDRAAVRAIKSPAPEPKESSEKVCVTIGPSTNYITVPPAFSPQSCSNLAGSIGAERYALACSSGYNVDSGDSASVKDNNAIAPRSDQCRWQPAASVDGGV